MRRDERMAVASNAAVSQIEGIGVATERLLRARGLFTVYDLLRASSPALHSAVSSIASLGEVRSWRQMAVLLEVAAVTPQWAEALVDSGITNVNELRRLDLKTLGKLFADAGTKRKIPDVPTTDQVVAILVDASVLDYSGALTGTVKDREGKAVKDAKVTAGASEALTDERGRFRLIRLLLGRKVLVRIRAQGLATKTVRLAPSPTSIVRVLQFTLLPDVAVRGRPSIRKSGNLSELSGVVIPTPMGRNVTSGEVTEDSLKVGDLFVLTEFYANGRDAKLVSKLLEYDGLRHIVHWVRLPKDNLPAGSAIGDHFLKVGTTFRKVKMSPQKLTQYKKLLRTRRTLQQAPAKTLEERYRRAAETLARMSGSES
jgi:hypothetical protein